MMTAILQCFVVVHWNVDDASPIPSWRGDGCEDSTTSSIFFDCVIVHVTNCITSFLCALFILVSSGSHF